MFFLFFFFVLLKSVDTHDMSIFSKRTHLNYHFSAIFCAVLMLQLTLLKMSFLIVVVIVASFSVTPPVLSSQACCLVHIL